MEKTFALRFRVTGALWYLLFTGCIIFTTLPAFSQGSSDNSGGPENTPARTSLLIADNTVCYATNGRLAIEGRIPVSKMLESSINLNQGTNTYPWHRLYDPDLIYIPRAPQPDRNTVYRNLTLRELVCSRKKDFELHDDLCEMQLNALLITNLQAALADKGYRTGLFVPQEKEAADFGRKITEITAATVREGRYRKQSLMPYLAGQNVRELLVLDSCILTVDVESAYTGKKSERRMTGAVILTIDANWQVYSGERLESCRPMRCTESVRAEWKDTYLRSRVPEIQDLLPGLTVKAAQAVTEAL